MLFIIQSVTCQYFLIVPLETGSGDADYNIIKNVNYLLTALEGINDSDFEEGRKDEIIGECHFLSALAYFRVLRQFGEYWDDVIVHYGSTNP